MLASNCEEVKGSEKGSTFFGKCTKCTYLLEKINFLLHATWCRYVHFDCLLLDWSLET